MFEDINECLSDPCDLNANCTNQRGSFYCTCNNGYSGNGFTCNGKHFNFELICNFVFVMVSISKYLFPQSCTVIV